jgi:lipid A 4'-phosphatase
MNKLTITLLAISAIFTVIFIAFPDADLVVSAWFYDGISFPYRDHWLPNIFYYLIRIISVGTIIWCFASLSPAHFKPAFIEPFLPERKHYAEFILIAMLLGPGAIVHQGFKEYFERARPVNIEQFGGEKTYSAPFIKSDQEGKSFISGHAAMGFFVCAFAFLANGKRRTQLYMLGLCFGIMASSMRIIQGGHFLSDVIFGGLVTLLTIDLIYYLVVAQHKDS